MPNFRIASKTVLELLHINYKNSLDYQSFVQRFLQNFFLNGKQKILLSIHVEQKLPRVYQLVMVMVGLQPKANCLSHKAKYFKF